MPSSCSAAEPALGDGQLQYSWESAHKPAPVEARIETGK
jgi:hypothetical protein